MSDLDDPSLAAVLVLALEGGLLSAQEVVGVVDRELVQRASPEAWLVEVSLAHTPADVLQALRLRADEHALLSDGVALLECMDLALEARGADPSDLAARLVGGSSDRDYPEPLRRRLYELEADVACAYDDGTRPPPKFVERTLRALFADARALGSWRGTFRRVLARVEERPASTNGG